MSRVHFERRAALAGSKVTTKPGASHWAMRKSTMFCLEVQAQAVRLVLEDQHELGSPRARIVPVAGQLGWRSITVLPIVQPTCSTKAARQADSALCRDRVGRDRGEPFGWQTPRVLQRPVQRPRLDLDYPDPKPFAPILSSFSQLTLMRRFNYPLAHP